MISKHPYLAFLLLALLTVIVYWSGLSGPFVLDDAPNIFRMEPLHEHPQDWPMHVPDIFGLGRPLAFLTFIPHVINSGLDPWPFKLGNLILHIASGYLIFGIALRIMALTPERTQKESIALAITGLWLLSPFLVSTVLYPVQRMAQLSTFFALLALILYFRFRPRMDSLTQSQIALFLSGLLLVTGIGVLGKENAILIPLYLLLVELVFFRFAGSKRTARSLKAFYLLFVVVFGILGLAMLFFYSNQFLNYGLRHFDFYERLLTESRIVTQYLANLIVPSSSQFGLYHDDIVVSRSLFEPITTLFSIAFIGTALGTAVWMGYTKSLRPAGFGVAFFFATHLIESTIVPLELYFEHRNYLGSFGIYLAVAFLLYKGIGLFPTLGRLRHAAFLFVILFAFSTSQRALTWSSLEMLLLTNQISNPDSPRLHTELLQFHILHGNKERAEETFDRLIRISPPPLTAEKLQFLQIYCYTGEKAPDSVYSSLTSEASPKQRIYLGNAINGLNELQREAQCKSIDWPRLIEFYEQIYREEIEGGEPWKNKVFWTVRLRLAEGFLFNHREELAYKILDELDRENPLAQGVPVLLAIAALNTNRHERTREMIKLLETGGRHLHTNDLATMKYVKNALSSMKETVAPSEITPTEHSKAIKGEKK